MNSFIILSQHRFQFINVTVVLFFLQSNIHDSFWNVVIHFLELFSFLNKHFEIISEVYFITVLSCLYQNLFFQKSHSFLHDSWIPLSKLSLLIMIYFFNQVQIISFDFFILLLIKFIFIFMEFNDWAFHSLNQWFCPTDYACNWRLASANDSTFISIFIRFFSFVEKFSVGNELFVITVQNLCVFSLQFLRNFIQSLDWFEVIKQIKSSFTRS